MNIMGVSLYFGTIPDKTNHIKLVYFIGYRNHACPYTMPTNACMYYRRTIICFLLMHTNACMHSTSYVYAMVVNNIVLCLSWLKWMPEIQSACRACMCSVELRIYLSLYTCIIIVWKIQIILHSVTSVACNYYTKR